MSNQIKSITKKSEDISGWYNDVIKWAKLAEHGPAKGTMIIQPYGYALWENIQKIMDVKIKSLGTENCYFPLFIPNSFLQKEEAHLKGFSPELAVVTHGGGEQLVEPLVVRPTSETIMYDAFSRWIQSFRDLPLKINQWCNVVRWEKRPYLFLRTTEFLWQEGHTAHETNEEAQQMVDDALAMYIDVYKNYLSIFGYAGKKSESEKFPGANSTFTYEMLMPDGKVIQGCTSHNLGQNFAKVFKVQYQDRKGEQEFVWQTSWGFSTRSIGALILAHGDDNGLVLPPMIAPIQVVYVPIFNKSSITNQLSQFNELSLKLVEILKELNIRFRIDSAIEGELLKMQVKDVIVNDASPGWKFSEYDLKGVPIRIEVGPREVESDKVRIVRRDTLQSYDVSIDKVSVLLEDLLKQIQENLLEKSKKFTHDNTRQADNYDQFKEIMSTSRGFIEAFWCEDPNCEAKIKEDTKATTRCLPLDVIEIKGECVYCKKSAKHRWLFAQSY